MEPGGTNSHLLQGPGYLSLITFSLVERAALLRWNTWETMMRHSETAETISRDRR